MNALTDALAVFRLTRLVVDDKIAEPFREAIWAKHPPQKGGVGYLVSCPFCSSLWLAAGVVVARRLAPRAWQPAAEILALSAVAGEAAARAGHVGHGRPS